MALDFEKIDLGGFGVDSQIQDETATVVKSNMGEAFKENPDDFAKNLQLSKASGIPEFAVKGDPVEVETKLKLDKIDFSTMSQRNPNTAKYLVDFNNAVIAQDDLDSLTGIENVLTPVSDVARSLPAGFIQSFGSAFEGAGRVLDVGSRTLSRGLDVILPEAADPYLWSTDDTPEALKALKILEPQTFLKWEGAGLKQAALDMGAPEDRQNVATDISSAVGSMGGQLMAYLMNPTASLGMLFSQGVDIQGEKQQETGTEGQSLQSDAAQLMGGVITGATEKMGLDAIVNRIPPNIKNAALRQIADVSLAGGIEAVQEVTESIAQNVLELYTTNPDAEIFEGMGREALAAGGAGAIVRAIVNSMIPGKARALSESEAFAEQLGAIEQGKIDAINLNAENSKSRQRDTEFFRKFVQQTDGDQNTTVFMDSAQVALYLQTKRPDEIANDPALLVLSKSAREAATLGTDVTIPVADFATDIAGTPHYEQLRDHMTLSQETVTPFRQEQARVETTNYIQRMVAEAETNISEYVEAQEIYNTVRDQLIDSGMVSGANASTMAQIVPAWATSFAKREGITVAEAFARSGLTIQGPQTGEAARLSAEALAQSPTSNYFDLPTIKQFKDLKIKKSKEDEKIQAASAYADEPNDFLPGVREIKLSELILPNEDFYESEKEQTRIKELAEEIKKNNWVTPVLVSEGTQSKKLRLAEGQHRARALRLLGYDSVPARVTLPMEFFYKNKKSKIKFNQESDTGARGYYDPANAIIRLNESADLSTFLHEFAHFMYEMEMKAGSKTIESVNNWFKRNAEAVAKEANSYIGAEGDLAQGVNIKDFSDEAIKKFASQADQIVKEELKKLNLPNEVFDGIYLVGSRASKTNRLNSDLDLLVKTNPGVTGDYNNLDVLNLEEQIEKRLKEIKDVDWFVSPEFDNQNFKKLLQDTIPTGEEGSITTDDVINFLDTGTSGDAAKDSAIRRATHEQFARGFETYLMEGKAPSIELRNAFRTFARWLVQIYQSIKGDLRVRLDDEVRQVFDRLLATEEQIIAAESRLRYEPMFTDAAMAGMSEQEFIDYKKRQEKVKDKQSETLRDKIIKQLTRQTEQWWRDEKQDLIREEVAKLNEQPVYAARTRLTSGDLKLDHATVKEMVGETFTNARGTEVTRIPPELVGMTAKGQAGIHPDEAAAFLGYSSGSELIHDLMTAPKIMDAAAMNAEQRMLDTHGDILNDGSIEQQADEAVMNEERGKLFLDELKALSKGTNAPSFDHATVKAIAQERIARLSFRENHPAKYRNAEIRAAQESAAMLAKGNREGAAAAKARQVLNYYLAMASTEARNETDKIVTRMARYNKKTVREEIQKADGGYWDQIVKILQRFEFRKSATLSQVAQQNQDINTWAKERIETDGDGLVLSPIVMNESYVTHWKNVPFGDLQGVADSVKNIEHVARYANKITRMGEEVDFNQLVARWTASMNEKATDRFTPKRTDVIEGRNWGRWAMAQMTKIPYMASWMDGGERTGISHQILVQPFTDAYSAEMALWRQVGKPVMDAIEGRSKADIKRQNQKIFIPEINDNLFGHQIIAVALNTGNAGNLRKMLLGEGWANPDNDAEINFNNPKLQAVLRHMTKSDWELVQLIWDQMEVLYPQLAEVHRRTTGLTPPKVEAVPVVTPYGEFRGGYYPVKYDPGRSHQAEQNEEKRNAQIESMFSGSASIQASVNAGSTNERTGYYAPIRLSLDVVPAHFQESIHYITHHDPVREVNRLIRNKSVADTIKAKLGPEEYAQLKPWLNDIAKDGQEAPTKTYWDSMLQRLRFGVTLGTMGFKASTGIIQISGLSNTIGEVGLAPVMQSVRSILSSKTNMVSAWEFAKANSKVLENRAISMDREIKNTMNKLSTTANIKTGNKVKDTLNAIDNNSVLKAAQEVSMKHIALIQTYMVDLPSWHAAYIKGMNEWGDEQRAFQYADWVIEQVQGSGATKDLARIMRGQNETGRMLTMFMTFFSSLWNLERDLVKGAKSGRYSTTTLAAKAMFLFTLPVLFDMLMKGELGGDEDDEESTLQKMLTKVALYPLASVPFMRDIANGLLGEYGYNISPLASIMEQGISTIPKVVVNGFTDEEITGSQAKGATKFIGAAFGVPGTSQAWATGEHIYQVVEEGEEFSLHSLLFGPEKK